MASQASEIGLERRAVGLPTALGTTFSLIVATSVLTTVAGGFFASWVWLIALAIALLTMYMAALSFSELATMIPKAGSMNEYVRAGMGPFFATITVLVGYIAIQLFPGSAEAFAGAFITSDVLGAGLGFKWWVVIYVGFLTIINLAGIKPFAALEVLLTFFVAASLLIIGIIGLAGVGTNDPIGTALPDIDLTWSLLSTLLGLAIFTFVGVEYTCPLAEELKRPSRDIPVGILGGLGLIAVVVVIYGLGAARYLDAETLAGFSPTIPVDYGVAVLGDGGKWWMGIVTIMAMLGTLNAVLAGVPRILYGMGLTRQLPSFFSYLLPTTRAPAVGIILMALAPILMNAFDQTPLEGSFIALILAGVLGWATAYFIIHLSLITLRLREPAANRPFRSPWFPIPQILGMGLLALAAFKVFPDPAIRDDAYRNYGIFMAVAVGFSLLYNLYAFRSASIFKPVPLAEVYSETERISEDIGVEVEPGGPHLHHDDR